MIIDEPKIPLNTENRDLITIKHSEINQISTLNATYVYMPSENKQHQTICASVYVYMRMYVCGV